MNKEKEIEQEQRIIEKISIISEERTLQAIQKTKKKSIKTQPLSKNQALTNEKKIQKVNKKLEQMRSEKGNKKKLSYLDKIDQLVLPSKGNYFEMDVEELVIKKMMQTLEELNTIIEPFETETRDLNSQLMKLKKKNEELRRRNELLKKRMNSFMSLHEGKNIISITKTLKFLKPSNGKLLTPL